MLGKLIRAFNWAEDAVLAYFFVGLGILIVIDIPGNTRSYRLLLA